MNVFRPPGISRIDEVVESYRTYLCRYKTTNALSMFARRLINNQNAAEAEAIVFSILWSLKLRPDVFEDPAKGGPDFLCSPQEKPKFIVEVTSLENTSVSSKSTLPNKICGPGGQSFSFTGPKIIAKAKHKAPQLAGNPHPCLLFVTCNHPFSDILMSEAAAQNILLSDLSLISSTDGNEVDSYLTTDLSHSVFLRQKASETSELAVESRLSSISAIVLLSISYEVTTLVGALHPQPARRFDPSSIPDVPYVRLESWPVVDGQIKTEWVNHPAGVAKVRHSCIR